MIRSRIFACLVTLFAISTVALTPSSVLAQEETENTIRPIGGLAFADEIEVTLVNIVAHVTDKKGNPISDLTVEDFRIFHDGERREITNFELFTKELYKEHSGVSDLPELTIPTEPVEEEEESEVDLNPIYVVLYIDNENIHPLDRNRVLNRLNDFVRENLWPPVQMMVVSYDRSVDVIQSFTPEPDRVITALRTLRTHTGGFTERQDEQEEIYDLMERIKDELQRSSSLNQNRREMYEALGRIRAFADQEYNDLAFTLDALRGIAGTIAGLPGKKSVVYVANGIPMIPGLGLFQAYAHVFDQPAVSSHITVYDRTSIYRTLVSTANAQGVTFHTIGAGGLKVTHGSGARRRSPETSTAASMGHENYLNSLRYLADNTGGHAVVGTNDIGGGLEKIGLDMFTFYSLGYPVSASGTDKVHKVKIELPGHSDYEIRYQRRFVEKSLATQVQDKVISALMFELEDNPLDIRLEVENAAPATEDRWILPSKISVPLKNVALLPEGEEYVGRVVYFLAARDEGGNQSDVVRQDHEIRIPAADYEVAKDQRYSFSSRLLLERGEYRLVVGFLDQVTRQSAFDMVSKAVR